MPAVSVTHAGYDTKIARSLVTLSALPSRGAMYTHDNDVGNVLQSVYERVLGSVRDGVWTPTLLPEKGAFTGALWAFRRRVVAQFGAYSLPLSHDQFVDVYRGQKKKRYAAAAASLQSKPVVRADSHPSVFLKAEKWYERKAGRLISARHPRYNLAVGTYLLPIEHRMYKAVDGVFGSPTIMKGYTHERRAAVIHSHYSSFVDCVAVGQDFSKFDQHISRDALKYEHAFYDLCYGDRNLTRLLARQLGTTCYATLLDGKVVYKLRGGRMSGDMNTALGNCILSAALIWAYAHERGIKVRVIVDGDDSVTFLERRDLARYRDGIAEWMREKGFILVSEEPVFDICQVEFCQAKYTRLAVPTMVRNPIKAITQDHEWIVDRSIAHEDVLSATGLGGLSLYGACPVLGAYYHMLSKASPNAERTLRRLATQSSWLRFAGETGTYVEATEEARFAFWETWGMEPGEQRAIEAYFHSLDLSYLRDCRRSFDHQNVRNTVYFPSLNQFT
uniref:RNA-directed RNA polymerase n=1 Tax=Changjiang tombus-like virus 13 TaxID=1922806 RepID=A0A1L3KFV1_9VIRU|nr:hypothetical protein 2 [Changjiang tombus-like virus 13]